LFHLRFPLFYDTKSLQYHQVVNNQYDLSQRHKQRNIVHP
jgi:hypothetical protein